MRTGNWNIVELLIEKGADINVVNEDNNSALNKAISSGKSNVERHNKN